VNRPVSINSWKRLPEKLIVAHSLLWNLRCITTISARKCVIEHTRWCILVFCAVSCYSRLQTTRCNVSNSGTRCSGHLVLGSYVAGTGSRGASSALKCRNPYCSCRPSSSTFSL
jgi:hypothetical protein